jgi:hypothetical protein
MNVTLHPDWRTILFHSWTVRLQLILGFFTAVDAAIAYAADGKVGWSLGIFGWSIATTVARVVKQAAISGPAGGGDDE